MTARAQALPALAPPDAAPEPKTKYPVIAGISSAHFLNDMLQSLIVAIYPLLKADFELSFAQVGLTTLTFQLTASLLQPLVGLVTDRKPMPYSLPAGMGFSATGLVLLSVAPNFPTLLVAAALIGLGSSIFHPESSRVARMASGGKHGLAQSLFQVGGNAGSSFGPLLAAWVVVPYGRGSVGWFALGSLLAIVILLQVSRWYAAQNRPGVRKSDVDEAPSHFTRKQIVFAISILGLLIFSKYFYMASLSSYYTFYLIEKFGVSVQSAQTHLFVFLGAVAAGTVVGGPVGDRIGRKYVIWASILGVAPFTLLLPHVGLALTGVLTVFIGFILASAFSAILVYAQELVPGRVGMISGLFFGFAFGMGGIGAAVLGNVADAYGIEFVYRLCAYLPLLGIVAAWLPDMEKPVARAA